MPDTRHVSDIDINTPFNIKKLIVCSATVFLDNVPYIPDLIPGYLPVSPYLQYGIMSNTFLQLPFFPFNNLPEPGSHPFPGRKLHKIHPVFL